MVKVGVDLLNIKGDELAVISEVKHPDEKMQRRLFDLGFYPGTPIKRVLTSPKGDPRAYKIRGTTIALRNSDAQYIFVEEK